MSKEEPEVIVEFPKLTEQTREHYYSAIRSLRRAGIRFPMRLTPNGIEWDICKIKGGKIKYKEK